LQLKHKLEWLISTSPRILDVEIRQSNQKRTVKHTVSLAREKKQEEIESAEVRRERAVLLANEEKQQDIEIACINREAADEAEAQKTKLTKLEGTALQEAEFVHADEQKETVRAIERANRMKQIEVIEAEQDAEVERQERQVREPQCSRNETWRRTPPRPAYCQLFPGTRPLRCSHL
jgi:hypothetical protein